MQRDRFDQIGGGLFDLKDESVDYTGEVVERHKRGDSND
jgi:hypothetical protein